METFKIEFRELNTFEIEFKEIEPKIELTIAPNDKVFQIEFKESIVIHGEGIPYEGEYEVDPKFYNQQLGTRGKNLSDNINVHAIEVSRVPNSGGGKTVFIGGVING